jgi:uncharacterized membrane protein YkoI
MSKTRWLGSGAVVFLLVSGVTAFAVPRAIYPRPARTAELAAANAGQGSLNRAISAVEELTGGRVVEIHFDTANGAGHYEATIARNGTMDHAIVNLATRRVAILDQDQAPARTFEFRDKAGAEMIVRSSKVPLPDAVASAEQASRGVAIAAETTRSADGYMVVHDIETVRADAMVPVLVDAKTGQVIADPQPLVGGP